MIILSAAFLPFGEVQTPAAEYTWIGSSGTWNTSTSTWIGPGPQWINSSTNVAVFGGTPSSVILLNPNSDITAQGMVFTSGNITIAGTSSRRLNLGDSFSSFPFIEVDTARATIRASIRSSLGLLKTGIGELVLSGSNSIAGPVRPADGLLTLWNSNALAGSQLDMNLADGGNVAFGMPASQSYSVGTLTGSRDLDLGGNTLLLSGGNYSGTLGNGTLRLRTNSFTMGTPTTLSGVTLDMNSADNGSIATVTSGTIILGGLRGSRPLSLTNYTTLLEVGLNDQSTTYSGTVTAAAFTKSGTGTLTLTSGSAYLGPVRITSGLIGVGNVSSLARATVNMSAEDSGSLSFVVPGQQTYEVNSLIGSRGLDLNGNTLLLSGGTFSGVMSNGGLRLRSNPFRIDSPIALSGVTLDMNSADTGSIATVTSGTIILGGLRGSRPLSLTNYTTVLEVGLNDQSTTYSGTVTAAAFTKSGTGTLTLTSGSAYLGPVRITSGLIGVGNVSSLARATVNMNAEDSGSLSFDVPGQQAYEVGSLIGSRGLDLNGNTLLLSGGTYSGVLNNGALRLRLNPVRIDSPIALSGVTLDMNSADSGSIATLTSGTVVLGGLRGSRALSLSSNTTLEVGSNDQSTTYSGTVTAAAFTKSGSGTLTLASGSAYLGPIRIASGLIGVGNVSSLARATVNMSAEDSGSLSFVVPGQQTYEVNSLIGSRGLDLNGNTLLLSGGTFSGVMSNGGLRLRSNPFRLDSPIALSGVTLDMNSADSGSIATLTSGTVVLGGLRGSRALQFTNQPTTLEVGVNDQSTTYSGTVTAAAFTKSGSGTLTFTSGSSLRSSIGSATIRLAEGQIAAAHKETLAAVIIDLNSSDNGSIAWTAPGVTTYSLGGIQGSRSINCDGLSMTVGNATSTTFAGTLLACGTFTKVGAGTLTMTGFNDFSNGLILNAGSLQTALGGIGTTGLIRFAGGTLAYAAGNATDYSSRFSSTAGQIFRIDTGDQRVQFNASLTSAGGSLVKAGAGALTLNAANPITQATISQGTLQFGPYGSLSSGSASITNNGVLAFSCIDPVIQSGAVSGTGDLTVVSGSVRLTAANTFSGLTRVESGTLALGRTTALGSSTLDMAANDAGQIVFEVGAIATYSIGGLQGTRSLSLGGNSLTIGANSTNTTYAGVISGSGRLTKTGAGTLTLTGRNDYSGGTLVSSGTLIGDTTSVRGEVINNAFVIFDQVALGTYSGQMSGFGTLIKDGAGELVLSGSNSYSGGTRVISGTLRGSTTSLRGAIVNDAVVHFEQIASGTYAGGMIGVGTLLKSGPGELTLSGSNDYSGGTRVSAGLVRATAVSLRGAISNDAIVTFDQRIPGIYSGRMTGSGSLTKEGEGALTLAGANSYSGGTRVMSGTLIATSASLGGNIVNNATVVFDQAITGTYLGDMAGSGAFQKTGLGVLTLGGSTDNRGGTIVAGGTLLVNGTASGAFNVLGSATLGGSGLVGGVTNVSGQATLSPGDLLPGRLGFLEEVIWQPGSNYNWQIVDATGTAGTPTGWDTITSTGSLTLAATPADPMRLNLWGLQLTNPVVSGSIGNFSPTSQYRWSIATAEKGIFGFNGDAVVINSGGTNGTGGFTNDLAGGSFSLEQSGTSLDILFTPAPIILNVPTGTMTQSEAGYPNLSSGAAIVKQGDGVIVLNASNQYTGTTTISAGSILLEGIGSMAKSSLVQIDAEASLDVMAIEGGYSVPAGQTLAGSGTVFGSITFGRGSTLSPGVASTASSPDLSPRNLSDPALESHAVPEPSTMQLVIIASGLVLISRLRRHALVEASIQLF